MGGLICVALHELFSGLLLIRKSTCFVNVESLCFAVLFLKAAFSSGFGNVFLSGDFLVWSRRLDVLGGIEIELSVRPLGCPRVPNSNTHPFDPHPHIDFAERRRCGVDSANENCSIISSGTQLCLYTLLYFTSSFVFVHETRMTSSIKLQLKSSHMSKVM